MFSRLGSIVDILIIVSFLVLMAFSFMRYGEPKASDINEEKKGKRTIVELVEAGGHGLLFMADLFKKTEVVIDNNSEVIEMTANNTQLALNEIDNLTKAGMEEIGYHEFKYKDLKEAGFWQDAWRKIKSANFISLWKTYWQRDKD